MERPEKELTAARILAVLLLLAVAGLFLLESKSPLARTLREKKQWSAWIALGPRLFFCAYDPARRALNATYVPGDADRDAEKLIKAALPLLDSPQAEDAPLFAFAAPADFPQGEPPAAFKAWAAENLSGLLFWKNFFSAVRGGAALPRFDLALLALELHGVPPAGIRPTWLSAEKASASAAEPSESRPITAEVFNASGQKGVASRATKILRSKGLDVVYSGNAAVQPRTMIYDRTGRLENASRAAEMLDCPAAQAVTQVDLKKLVDVTVVLAADCPVQEERKFSIGALKKSFRRK